MLFSGSLLKLKSEYVADQPVQYQLGELNLNQLIGQQLTLEFNGQINCIFCSRAVKKTFSDGYCYPCFQKLARCDTCIVRPEKCHYHLGTCREPEWGKANCFIKHAVYLANTTGFKVGITRAHQKLVRWVDQGALAATVLFYTSQRLHAGEVEIEIAKIMSDRTDWRGLLTGKIQDIDLLSKRAEILGQFNSLFDANKISMEEKTDITSIIYPVKKYLAKAVSINLDKTHLIKDELLGIRGQYLLFNSGGLNIRKFQGYQVSLSAA